MCLVLVTLASMFVSRHMKRRLLRDALKEDTAWCDQVIAGVTACKTAEFSRSQNWQMRESVRVTFMKGGGKTLNRPRSRCKTQGLYMCQYVPQTVRQVLGDSLVEMAME